MVAPAPAPPPPVPTAPPHQWIELAKIAQESFHNRRALEWKLAFGFWTAIGSLTAVFLLNDLQRPLCLPFFLAVFYVIAFVVAYQYWLLPLQTAHAGDKAWRRFYLDQSQGAPHEIPRPAKDEPAELTANNNLWLTGQAAFTALFLALSWYAIVFVIPVQKETKDCCKDANLDCLNCQKPLGLNSNHKP